MINFSESSMINLQKINSKDINANAKSLILEGENIIGVYKTIRDQIIFTDKRIMTVDVKGITGKKQEIFSLPYSKIQYFGIQTVGFAELIPDSELAIYFNNGLKAHFEFKGNNDILEIGKNISKYTLQ